MFHWVHRGWCNTIQGFIILVCHPRRGNSQEGWNSVDVEQAYERRYREVHEEVYWVGGRNYEYKGRIPG